MGVLSWLSYNNPSYRFQASNGYMGCRRRGQPNRKAVIVSIAAKVFSGIGRPLPVGLGINSFSQSKIDATINELREERAMLQELLG